MTRLEIFLHLLFWFFSLWMLNQNFSFESLEVRVIDGVRKGLYTKDYQLVYFLGISLLAKVALVYSNAFWVLPAFLKHRDWTRFIMRLIIIFSGALMLEFALLQLYATLCEEPQKAKNYYTLWHFSGLRAWKELVEKREIARAIITGKT